jgi:hypothetical protein
MVDVDPAKAVKFGVASGALWTFAIALFIALVFLWDGSIHGLYSCLLCRYRF